MAKSESKSDGEGKTKAITDRKSKSKGEPVNAKIPKEQFEMIEKLDGTLGVGVSGVVSSIINSWFEQQEWYRDKIKKKLG